MCFYYCAKYILSAHICKKILSVTPGHPKTRQQTTNSVSPQEDEFMAVCHKTLTKKNLLSQQNVSILSLENVIFIFNFYRMEKVLLFLVPAIIGAYLTCRTAPLAARERKGGWLLYAVGSAFFASLTAILGKIGISGVESNLGTAIRTCVVLVMAWGMVFVTGKQREVRKIGRKEMGFICLSGVATGASWLCYYRALQEGPASIVAPVDKLSVLVTVVFSYFVFGEKLGKKEAAGLALLTAGTVAMALL